MPPPKPAQPGKSNAFFEEVARLDRGIADRWKLRARNDPKYRLKGADVEFIVLPLLRKERQVNERHAAALMKLLGGAEFTDEGLIHLRVFIQVAEDGSYLMAGATPLVSANELKPVNNALGMGTVAGITFKSPGTGLSYSPSQYRAIQALIAKNDIAVLEVRLAGLEKFAGLVVGGTYVSDINRLFVYQHASPAQLTIIVVHEVTHAIQDWRNVRTTMKYAEADAYIAGAVADLSLRTGKPTLAGPVFDPAIAAARLVIGGEAVSGNAAWEAAYKAVVADVAKSPVYKKVKDIRLETIQKGEGNREKDKFDALLTGIEMKQRDENFAAMAAEQMNP